MKNEHSTRGIMPILPMMLISGIMMFIIGIYVLISPSEAYFSLSLILAVGLGLSVFFHLYLAFTFRRRVSGWLWLLGGAIIDIALAAYLFYFPMLTMILLPVLIGIWLLLNGFMEIGRSLNTTAYSGRHWFGFLLPGVIIFIFSFLILDNPLMGMINIVSWMALLFITSGLLRIFFSFRLFNAANAIR
ncbi:HdeD family acid-resistance protein [Pedobacter paludis]|uniref:DUF308 domain-containing protein n=1 Tax=Pedobacter paludis TaxID=2203212 RepID=A0A317EU18_9SPHI|nr:DUF308 domain-containing protein [Pedobacter paludis]PWS30440.1 hypothetical protein DF947_18640 [Pedobacter paludis]